MGGNPSLSLFLNLFSTFLILFAFIFTFIFFVFFDVCCCFSISLLGAKDKGTSKGEIQPQNNSTNEEKMQSMQIPAKFFFYTLRLFSFLLVLHAIHNDCHFFSISMLIFLRTIKGMSMGGSFLENLKFFKMVESMELWYSMHDLVFYA